MARMATEEVLEEIKKVLWWDYDKDCWKDPVGDPGWTGLDELCEIERILIDGGCRE
jgi:hypothetical protein